MLETVPGASKHTKVYIYFIHADDLAECKSINNFSKD